MNSPKRKQNTLRLPIELNTRLEHNSEKIGISKNAYIVMLLTKAIDNDLLKTP